MNQQELETFAKTLDPSARIVVKEDSWLMSVIAVLVWLFNRDFKTMFATTICNRVYIPRSWFTRDLRRLIVHEVEGHVQQCRKCGLGLHPWVGFPIFMLLYLVLFFPLLGAYFRYWFELDADSKAWRWMLKEGSSEEEVMLRAERFAGIVASWQYFKPWPRKWVLDGFRKKFQQVLAAHGAS